MTVLRLPAVFPMGFVASAHRYHRPCSFAFVSPGKPLQVRLLPDPVFSAFPPTAHLCRILLAMERRGPPRFLGSPLVPLPRS